MCICAWCAFSLNVELNFSIGWLCLSREDLKLPFVLSLLRLIVPLCVVLCEFYFLLSEHPSLKNNKAKRWESVASCLLVKSFLWKRESKKHSVFWLQDVIWCVIKCSIRRFDQAISVSDLFTTKISQNSVDGWDQVGGECERAKVKTSMRVFFLLTLFLFCGVDSIMWSLVGGKECSRPVHVIIIPKRNFQWPCHDFGWVFVNSLWSAYAGQLCMDSRLTSCFKKIRSTFEWRG